MSIPALPASLKALAQARFERYQQAAREQGLSPLDLSALPGDAERVLACSNFVAIQMERHPALVDELVDSGDLLQAYTMSPPPTPLKDTSVRLPALSPEAEVVTRFERCLWQGQEPSTDAPAGLDEAEALRRLRVCRRREWVRLAWRDIGGLDQPHTLMSEASAYADAAVRFALTNANLAIRERLGEPRSASGDVQDLTVLALGKLGAGELNFSSDIDLIFAYPEAGETAGGRRSLSNHEYFLRIARQLIKLLTHPTADGTVFRVDMRLRPFGDGGPLVMSFDALEEYYQSHGRDWERYAMIRARPVTGTEQAARDLEARLRPFIYRRYLDFGTLELLRDMKRSMIEEVNRRGLQNNVKLGSGGIREVEFTAQAFQMVRGGRITVLRDRCLLRVLPRLASLSLLPDQVVQELIDGYLFLRKAEHRLQQLNDQQLHELPDEANVQELIAAGMGFASWPSFMQQLNRHRNRINGQFAQVFGANDEDAQSLLDPLCDLLKANLATTDGELLLSQAGFKDTAAAWEALSNFKNVNDVRLLDGAGARRLQTLLPDLLRAVANQGKPVIALDRVLSVIQAVVRRSAYLSLLVERPLGLAQLVKLCAASPWIARQLARHPILLDELLDTQHLYAPMTIEELREDLDTRLQNITAGDIEEEMECLRQFKHAAVLRVAASDVGKAIPLMRVSDHLTEIAEINVRQALAFAWRDLCGRHGTPHYDLDGESVPAPFAVIAYGKMGGLELGYGSDLDLVFAHGGPSGVYTEGKKPIDNFVFFQRLGQRMIHFLSTPTPGGTVYEVDPRLRPSGTKGPLVVRFRALQDYLHNEAWTWEHQALVRARVVAGDSQLTSRFNDLRRDILNLPRDPATLRKEVREMRGKMRAALDGSTQTEFDLKQGAGGIADIEFMVQYCVLRWADRLGDWLHFTDNIRLLEGLSDKGLLSQEDAHSLSSIFQDYRGAIHAQALQELPGMVDGNLYLAQREAVAAIWQTIMVEPAGDG